MRTKLVKSKLKRFKPFDTQVKDEKDNLPKLSSTLFHPAADPREPQTVETPREKKTMCVIL